MLEKVQVVILKKEKNSTFVLLLQTNEARGFFWQNITGSREKVDHDIKAAAIREIKEEIGITVNVEKLIDLNFKFKYQNHQRNHDYEEFCFACEIESANEIQISAVEHSDFKWIDINQVSKDNYRFESNFKAFELAKKRMKNNG